jgi:ABC-type multidrug transport system ATPase subunit
VKPARSQGVQEAEMRDRVRILAIENLCRRFGKHEVLRNLDLSLGPGERVALRGPNGSGKTTVLRCIAGTLTPTSGSVTVAGHKAGSFEARCLTGTSLSQERSFYFRMSGRANLLFFSQVRGYSSRESARRIRALEDELELTDILAERVDRCSTGMVQQLAFARALLPNPPLLLLDEPTRSLDTAAVARLWAALDRRRESSVLVATHLQGDLEHCDRYVGLSPSSS